MKKKACDIAVRNLYQEWGVDAYYEAFGKDYSNPHEKYVHEVLLKNKYRIDNSSFLDLCCGAGEVTLAIGNTKTSGCDPYTARAYFEKTGKPCLPLSFDDIISKGLPQSYSSVICSFALHLCPEKKCYPLASRLFEAARQLIIITPHKRPDLERYDDILLDFEDYVLTNKGKKVRLKSYSHRFIQAKSIH